MTRDTLRMATAPAYLFLCLLLGGSAQGAWGNAILQILGIMIIAGFLLDGARPSISGPVRTLAILFAVAVLLVLIQLIPLPPAIWTALPGRQFVAEGRAVLGLPLGWSSISLAPYETMATLLCLLPPVAIFLAIHQAAAKNGPWLAAALTLATLAGIVLGLLQLSSGNPTQSPWYLYEYSNFGFATGFFANSNHMASLLLVALPFVAALGAFAAGSTKDRRKRYSLLAFSAGGAAVVMVGLALNGSLAGAGLLLPVALATLLMTVRLGRRLQLVAVGAGAFAFLGFLALLFTQAGERIALTGASTSISTRQDIFAHSVEAVKSFAPVGSGLGTYAKIYPLFEQPDSIDRTWVNHAHDDYMELAVETGLPGIILVVIFLLWWASALARMMSAPNASLFAKAGAIGSAAILVHSFVDFPLRTSAISSLFAFCLAMMLLSRSSPTTSKDLREARHLVIE